MRADSALWAPERRNFTAGLVLIVTLVAFEAMGLATALPTVVRELDAQRWYSWAFTVFMAASVVGTVVGGRVADRRGPALPLLLSLPAFAAGLVLAGIARGIAALLAARGLQGLAAGSLIVATYVMIARVYPEEHRPKAFGALSASWVVPAMVGPLVAGLLTEHLSWRWVFLGLAPLVCLAGLLLVPTVRRFGSGRQGDVSSRKWLTLAAVVAAVSVLAVNLAAQTSSAVSVALAVVGAIALLASLRVLFPRGTVTGRPGIPAMVLARGVLAGAFFGAQAFVPLTLAAVHGYSPALAGVPLTVGSLGWSAGAVWQGRTSTTSRERLVARGLVLVAVAVAGLAVVAPSWGPHWLVFGLWLIGGAGMGLATASTSVRVLSLSPAAERGFNSAALQLSGMLGQAVLVGLSGAVVTTVASTQEPSAGVAALALLLAAVALAGASLVTRGRRTTLERR